MVDYSKWKDIEVSDDEDDTHPNIDTASLFRWRHDARIRRMEEQEKERQDVMTAKKEAEDKLNELKNQAAKQKDKGVDNLSTLEASINNVESELAKIKEQELELKQKEDLVPWNVDTLSKAGFSKTVINAPPPKKKDNNLSDEELQRQFKAFIAKYEVELNEYGVLRKYNDSKRYLMNHTHLVCEDTAHYLVIWCIDLAMEKKFDLMEHVAHQCTCMQYILELSNKLEVDPRACVPAFFDKIQQAEPDYQMAFEDELRSFKERIRKRAKEKLDIAIKEIEKEERQKRLGPGGLDPVEVFESLPKSMQECFESKSIPLLQSVLSSMAEEDARLHLKRCIDSGLWVPDANKADTKSDGSAATQNEDNASETETEAQNEGASSNPGQSEVPQ